MAPLLRDRHAEERARRRKIRRQLDREVSPTRDDPAHAGGDSRYRIPLIGVNPGAVPGSRPDHAVR